MEIVEYGGLIVGYIWIAILFTISMILLGLSIKVWKQTKAIKNKTISAMAANEKKLQEKYNQIASLPPKELDAYLAVIFAKHLELNSASYVSSNDYEAKNKLFLRASADTVLFLGEGTIDAINYRYGNDYVYHWCEMTYKMLENRGLLTSIINQTMYSEAITNNINNMSGK